jgi:hypothetical protein
MMKSLRALILITKLDMFNQGVFSTFRPVFRVKKVIPIFNNFHVFIIININIKALKLASISDYFNIFVDSEYVEDMATETNRYAEQYFQKNLNLSRCSRFRKWVSTTAAEMKPAIILTLNRGNPPFFQNYDRSVNMTKIEKKETE